MQPPSPPYIPAKYHGGSQSVLRRIVLHSTVSATVNGGARSIARYFQNPSYESSAHYVVDPGEVIQCVYDHTIAWHDGTNSNSIGVEMCDNPTGGIARWRGAEHKALLRTTAGLVRQLCLAYDIPMRHLTPAQIRAGQKGICSHADMRDAFPGSTSHWDPGEFPWGEFLALVTDTQPTTQPTAKPQEDDMELLDRFDEKAITAHPGTVGHTLLNIKQNASGARAELAGLRAAVGKLAEAVGTQSGVSPAELKAAVLEAIEEGVVKVNVSVSGKEGEA